MDYIIPKLFPNLLSCYALSLVVLQLVLSVCYVLRLISDVIPWVVNNGGLYPDQDNQAPYCIITVLIKPPPPPSLPIDSLLHYYSPYYISHAKEIWPFLHKDKMSIRNVLCIKIDIRGHPLGCE